MKLTERIYNHDLGHELHLDETEAGLRVTAVDENDEMVVLTLDDNGVRKLKNALARYEKRKP